MSWVGLWRGAAGWRPGQWRDIGREGAERGRASDVGQTHTHTPPPLNCECQSQAEASLGRMGDLLLSPQLSHIRGTLVASLTRGGRPSAPPSHPGQLRCPATPAQPLWSLPPVLKSWGLGKAMGLSGYPQAHSCPPSVMSLSCPRAGPPHSRSLDPSPGCLSDPTETGFFFFFPGKQNQGQDENWGWEGLKVRRKGLEDKRVRESGLRPGRVRPHFPGGQS